MAFLSLYYVLCIFTNVVLLPTRTQSVGFIKAGLAKANFFGIPLPPGAQFPEALAFDNAEAFDNEGTFDATGEFFNAVALYTGVIDGRILKFESPPGRPTFAETSRNSSYKACYGITTPKPTCGRPLGIGFNYENKTLYIADAFAGLVSVGLGGGYATLVANSADGQPFKFPNGLDVDQQTGIVYFTDFSAAYDIRNVTQAVLNNDSTGRLLRYDPRMMVATTLLRNLSGPAGAAVSKDSSFVLVSEFIANRTIKFWVTGPKANTSEVFISSILKPDNIKRTSRGDFWIAAAMLKQPTQSLVPIGQRVSESGKFLQTVSLEAHYGNNEISEVQERNGILLIGSRDFFIGVYRP